MEVYHCPDDRVTDDPRHDEEWITEDAGDGYVFIRNRLYGYCLGVVGVDHHDAGALAEVYKCHPDQEGHPEDHGLDNQWKLKAMPEFGYYHIENRVSGLCLGVQGVDSYRAGALVEVYRCEPFGSDPGRDMLWSVVEPSATGAAHFQQIRNRVPPTP